MSFIVIVPVFCCCCRRRLFCFVVYIYARNRGRFFFWLPKNTFWHHAKLLKQPKFGLSKQRNWLVILPLKLSIGYTSFLHFPQTFCHVALGRLVDWCSMHASLTPTVYFFQVLVTYCTKINVRQQMFKKKK